MFIEAVLSSTSSLAQSIFIVFLYGFEQVKHIQQFIFNTILCGSLAQLMNQWSCHLNINSSSPCVSRKGQLYEGRHRGGS